MTRHSLAAQQRATENAKRYRESVKLARPGELFLTQENIHNVDQYLKALRDDFDNLAVREICRLEKLNLRFDLVPKLISGIEKELRANYGSCTLPTLSHKAIEAFIAADTIMHRDLSKVDSRLDRFIKLHHKMYSLGNLCFPINESEKYFVLKENGKFLLVHWRLKLEVNPSQVIPQASSDEVPACLILKNSNQLSARAYTRT